MVWAANDAMTGLAGGPLEGRFLSALFVDGDAASGKVVDAAADADTADGLRWTARLARDGGAFPVEVHAKPLPGWAGSGGAILVFGNAPAASVDEQVRARLLEQAAVLEHAPVGIVVTLPNRVKSW
jgi:hypothetical protein